MPREYSLDSGPRNVICAYYISATYGSEYRAGLEFIQFAASKGFDLAIVADLDENSSPAALEVLAPGIRVVRIPSPVKRQATLYRYSDLIPQIIWHLRVVRWLRQQPRTIQNLWVQNGASPWLPLVPYFGLAPVLIWGPVGGGEPPSRAMMQQLPWKVRLRETLRSLIEQNMLRGKFAATRRQGAPRIVAMARTMEAQRHLAKGLNTNIPVIPEILDPLGSVHLRRQPARSPRMIWVGQDIPRKNLRLALHLFEFLRRNAFPDATLDIFGCETPGEGTIAGVTFHGWVPRIEWQNFRNEGVLLLTSFREGLPSVVLEAARNGLLCVTSDVGAIGGLGVSTIFTLPREEYPSYSVHTLNDIVARIRHHLDATEINISPVSHRDNLAKHLCDEGALA